jgi:predicted DNA-binding protein YlxM (UPF0122 family)
MAITLSRLCANTEKIYNLKLLAGNNGMDKYVRWVHIIEDCEVPNFLHDNELIFTTGIGQHEQGWLLGFVKSLKENNASGLVINLGPYISSVPNEVLEYGDQNHFPIFTVPWAVHLIDMTYDFCHRIISSEEIELGLAAAFRNLIFSPQDSESYVPVLRRRGFHEESSYAVMVVQMISRSSIKPEEYWNKNRLNINSIIGNSELKTCMLIQEGRLVVIYQKRKIEAIQENAEGLCDFFLQQHEGIELHIGISDIKRGYQEVPIGYKQAVSAMQIALLRNKNFVCYLNIGIYQLLFGIENNQILRDFEKNTLGDLIKYDENKATDYIKTLQCYLKNDCSIQNTAADMQVHRNTINYKIKQIREILQCDFSEENKMNLLLSLHIYELLNLQI